MLVLVSLVLGFMASILFFFHGNVLVLSRVGGPWGIFCFALPRFSVTLVDYVWFHRYDALTTHNHFLRRYTGEM